MTTWTRARKAPLHRCAWAGLVSAVLAAPLPAGEITYGGSYATSAPGGCASCGQGGGTWTAGHCCGPKEPCPPKFCHVMEGPPRLQFKKGCPRPVCDPCNLEHFGYYPVCWSPWPYPADWSHCPYPVASTMLPPPALQPFTPKITAPRDERRPDGGREADEPLMPPATMKSIPKKRESTEPPKLDNKPSSQLERSEGRPSVRLIQ
jgi:hypothetical protein